MHELMTYAVQMEWVSIVIFCRGETNLDSDYIPFELNFGIYLWKEDLMVKMELSKLEDFLKRLQRSWKAAKKLMEMVKEAIKKWFNKKRYNL